MHRGGKMRQAILLAFFFMVVGYYPTTARGAGAASRSSVEDDISSQDPVVKAAAATERTEIRRLVAQEKREADAVANDKSRSESDRKAATKKLRKTYLNKRNAVRLKTRYELRAKLFHDPGPVMKDETK
jgi:hypothetical protein